MKLIWLYTTGALLTTLLCGFVALVPTYIIVNDGTARCQFNFPNTYQYHTDSESAMYTATSDEVAYEMNYRSTTNVESLPGQNFQSQLQNTSQADKLQQFANLLVQTTGGQIINQFAVTEAGQSGREIEIDFTEEGDTHKMFVRFFLHNNMLYAFSVVGVFTASVSATNSTNINDLITAKNQLFGSIDFY